MFTFLLFAQFVLINSKESVSGRQIRAWSFVLFTGRRARVGEGWGLVVDGGRLSRGGGHVVWDGLSPGLRTRRVSALSVCHSLGLPSETQ